MDFRKWAFSRGLKFAFEEYLAFEAMIKVIFMVYIFLHVYKKRESLENMYNARNSTFTVIIRKENYKSYI